MSHAFESGFVVGAQAWHGLATVLPDNPSIEDAIRLAGLDWRVVTSPAAATIVSPEGVEYVECPDHKVLIRDTDKSILGVVSRNYRVFQNDEAFGWFQPLVDEGLVRLETAGSLQNGRKVWVLARYAEDVEVKDGDKLIPYLLLATGHDGKLSIRITNTPIRVVCWNTLSAAGVKDNDDVEGFDLSGGYSISHTGNVEAKVEQARRAITQLNRELKITVQNFRRLAGVPATEEFVRAAAREVFDQDYLKAKKLVAEFEARRARAQEHGDVQIREETRAKIAELEALLNADRGTPTVERVVENFRKAPGADEAGATAWGAYNALTYHIDHGKRSGAERRLASSWFGNGAQERDKALAVVSSLAGL